MSFRPQYLATPPTLTDTQFNSGLVDSSGKLLVSGTLATTGNVSVVPGSTETKITAATIPAGGVGFIGWLSAIWYQLTQTLLATVTGNVASAATDSGNPVKVGGIYVTALPTFTTGQRGDLQIGVNGDLRTLSDLVPTAPADGVTNSSGNFGINGNSSSASGALRIITAPMKFNGTTWDRDRKPNATARLLSAAATTNGTSVKASAGDLYKIMGTSARVSACYLKLYNKASAPTVGTDTPVLTLIIPASSAFDFNFSSLYFSTGIAYAITTAAADADTGALTAGDVVGMNLVYA